MFRFRSAAFYQVLKSKVGFAAAKAVALQINLNPVVAHVVCECHQKEILPMHDSSRAPPLLPLLVSHNLPFSSVH
jgi:hypothetical protein